MSRPGIAVFLIVLNEQKNIDRCLRSLRWVDEIVIVDSGSADETVQICRRYTDKVFIRIFDTYCDQKNFALSLISAAWGFSVDADEEVPDTLAEEIQAILTAEPEYDAYRIHRSSRIFGREFRFSGTQRDEPIRLFKKVKGRFVQPIHEFLLVDGRVGRLQNSLRHYTYDNIAGYLERLNRYTAMEALYLVERKVRVTPLDFIVKPFLIFLKMYVVDQGFRDGLQGFVFCAFSAFYSFLKYVKALELHGRFRPYE